MFVKMIQSVVVSASESASSMESDFLSNQNFEL